MDPAAVKSVNTWHEFQQRWAGARNFLMAGECVPFAFTVPSLAQVVAELREDPDARITPGTRSDRLELTDVAAQFRAMPLTQALKASFGLAHFSLARFDAPGRFLHGFKAGVLDPWQAALRAAGFTFERCYPIVFISGRGCATNYHMDLSHVLAWQIYGTKRFCGLQDPDRWAPRETRVNYKPAEFRRPAGLSEADALCFNMKPGDVLWNALLTPHWVEAGDEVAMSINLSHGGIRFRGELCPHERELEEHRAAHPELAPVGPKGSY
ncbi:MAG: hypothetical protein K9N01_16375 [Cephaloticoccus sp.]|nr:hypothetical protein [Cephaloticoccus sp.]